MLFQTPTQFAVLVLCLVGGWLFGLASRSGGAKWKERYRAEEAAHKQYRSEVTADLKAREARLKEVEAERDRYSRDHAAAIAQRDTTVAVPAATAATGATVAAAHAHRDDPQHRSGLFGGRSDANLSRIRGIDERLEHALHDRGIRNFDDVERLSRADEAALEADLNLRPGTIEQEGWREQAAMLREGHDDAHRSRWH
jgi:predicted flap endonuclease-1-like 5' DNA nuclease